jgi:transketolase
MNGATDLDTTCVNTIRTLSMDAVQAANSRHPGSPMAMAPVADGAREPFGLSKNRP